MSDCCQSNSYAIQVSRLGKETDILRTPLLISFEQVPAATLKITITSTGGQPAATDPGIMKRLPAVIM